MRHPEPTGFTLETELPVREPYRLDLTADALRRLAANVVDVLDEDGAYRRVLSDEHGSNLVEVRQPHEGALQLRVTGSQPGRWTETVQSMLGIEAALAEWNRRVKPFPWLERLTQRLRGMHPPRYPSLWEALAHAIVFQQISIHAASAIMRRTVQSLSAPYETESATLHPFFSPSSVLFSADETLRAAGLSANKIDHLRSAAAAVEDGLVSVELLAGLSSEEAAAKLLAVRGIGPWSAAVVLLRGMGRLDVFPLKDSGVARSLRELSGDPDLEPTALLAALGPVRGFLYFHLLLGRMRNLAPDGEDSEST
jgi:DNA-3-methyladenine glycosylase II